MRAGIKPLRAIQVLASSHSGATLLGLLLGSHDQVFHGGTLRRAPALLSKPDRGGSRGDVERCSCGQWIDECSHWRAVADRLAEEGLELRQLAQESDDLATAMSMAEQIGRICLELSESRVLCDVSKRIARAAAWLESGDVSTVIVHLVRDPRAVGYSQLRKQASSEVGRRMETLAATIDAWIDYQDRVEELAHRHPHRCFPMRYEDLVRDTVGSLTLILKTRNLRFEPGMLRYRARPDHSLGGNRHRFDDDESIHLDDEYLRGMSDEEWDWVSERTRPQLRRYGYAEARAEASAAS